MKLFWNEKLFGLSVVLLVGLILVVTTVGSIVLGFLQEWQGAFLNWQSSPGIGRLGIGRLGIGRLGIGRLGIGQLGIGQLGIGRLWDWLKAPIPAVVSVVTFAILYRAIPHNRVTWRDVWLGGLIAGLVWEAGRQLFTWYLANFARYSLIYGSVGAIIAFLLWSYLSAVILLSSAEFTACYSEWRRAGHPVESRPLSQWLWEWSKWKTR